MSRSEPVSTSRRLRLRGQQRPLDLDGTALDELGECLANDADDANDHVDAVELAIDRGSAEDALDALGRLVDAEYDVQVRELVVEIRR